MGASASTPVRAKTNNHYLSAVLPAHLASKIITYSFFTLQPTSCKSFTLSRFIFSDWSLPLTHSMSITICMPVTTSQRGTMSCPPATTKATTIYSTAKQTGRIWFWSHDRSLRAARMYWRSENCTGEWSLNADHAEQWRKGARTATHVGPRSKILLGIVG